MTESVIYKNMIAGAEQQGDDDKDYKEEKYLGNYLRFKMKREGKRFWAGDNISDYVTEEQKNQILNLYEGLKNDEQTASKNGKTRRAQFS